MSEGYESIPNSYEENLEHGKCIVCGVRLDSQEDGDLWCQKCAEELESEGLFEVFG